MSSTEEIIWMTKKHVFPVDSGYYSLADSTICKIVRPSLCTSPQQQRSYQNVQENLPRLLRPCDNQAAILPEDLHKWDPKEFPGYPEFERTLAKQISQRVQLSSGNCSFHASATLQHYLLARVQTPAPMLDLTCFIREHLPLNELLDFVHGRGVSSVEMLQMILEPESRLLGGNWEPLEDSLAKYGPALVSNFHVHADFANPRCHHHYGKVQGAYLGRHAMVLLGIKMHGTQQRFLLQNWWRDKQFVEVDQEYLRSAHASFSFVTTPQRTPPPHLKFDMNIYHESVDVADCARREKLGRL